VGVLPEDGGVDGGVGAAAPGEALEAPAQQPGDHVADHKVLVRAAGRRGRRSIKGILSG